MEVEGRVELGVNARQSLLQVLYEMIDAHLVWRGGHGLMGFGGLFQGAAACLDDSVKANSRPSLNGPRSDADIVLPSTHTEGNTMMRIVRSAHARVGCALARAF